MSSALAMSVSTARAAPSGPYRSATRRATGSESAPMTIRSGWRQSWTAVPSARNSGLDTTWTSSRPRAVATRAAVPTGTVDLVITMAPRRRWGPISSATVSTKLRSAWPSAPWGVGRHRKTMSDAATARPLSVRKASRPRSSPSRTTAVRPSSTMGTSPAESRSTRASDRSVQATWWPRWARHAARVRPTYPDPMTAIRSPSVAPVAVSWSFMVFSSGCRCTGWWGPVFLGCADDATTLTD